MGRLFYLPLEKEGGSRKKTGCQKRAISDSNDRPIKRQYLSPSTDSIIDFSLFSCVKSEGGDVLPSADIPSLSDFDSQCLFGNNFSYSCNYDPNKTLFSSPTPSSVAPQNSLIHSPLLSQPQNEMLNSKSLDHQNPSTTEYNNTSTCNSFPDLNSSTSSSTDENGEQFSRHYFGSKVRTHANARERDRTHSF
ncbi:hypothetical protein Avbf_09513 [Armadillidium vulgare]|nr:hypothetical protein Avbf_09513 [Armadillidium vulgare]